MKTSRLFTIDTDLADRLSKVGNASALINDLLKDHFSIRANKNTIFDEKQAIMSNLKKKLGKLIRKLGL